ncbi:MAG: MogA/MoaB family molybdenum cofactor biosynthesis protein [Planctomycetota bacterium]|nr:MAG: MogA/MoaB family molybdenum cofactor biosynthesis protein [Planctomycetota bacterium]
MRLAILTVSDRCAAGEATDTAGPALAARASEALGARLVAGACVPDDRDAIAAMLRDWASAAPAPELILTTGGTGLAPRDITPEATLRVLERQHPGIVELMRARCGARHPRAYLSRAVAGTIGATLIINLPGSEPGALESFDAIAVILPHALGVLRGTARDCGVRRVSRGTAT